MTKDEIAALQISPQAALELMRSDKQVYSRDLGFWFSMSNNKVYIQCSCIDDNCYPDPITEEEFVEYWGDETFEECK